MKNTRKNDYEGHAKEWLFVFIVFLFAVIGSNVEQIIAFFTVK